MKPDRRQIERALKDVENRLRGKPLSVELKFERARLLDKLGRLDDARLGYVDVLQRDAAHFGALNNLGMLLYQAGLRNDALTCFNAAVAKHPDNAMGRANLAMLLLRGGEPARAREQYEHALRLDPNNVEAHRGLAIALAELGENERAEAHRDTGFARQPVVQLPYRGEGRPLRVLLVVSSVGGNVPTDRFLDDRVFAVAKLVAEYYDDATPLPAHDLLYNAIGDADLCAQGLAAAQRVAERSSAPVLNLPERVLQTARVKNPGRLNAIPGVFAPRAVSLGRAAVSSLEMPFPFLLRSPGFHTGRHFEKVERPEDVTEAVDKLPGEELLAIEYADVRSRDGAFRKYRVMFVGGNLYPLHLAISENWKVHYFSADMDATAGRRAEEERFLTQMPAEIGDDVVAALQSVRDTLGLDYAGVDFAIDASGRCVVFEANATMIVPTPQEGEAWAHRRAPIERIEKAIRDLLVSRASLSS